MSARRGGFTLVEIVVVMVIASVVVAALHRAQIQQRRVALWSSAVVRDHDGFRVAASLLSMELREAVAGDGDVILHRDDSLSVRAPLGFAFVCSVRGNPAAVGVSRSEGLAWGGAGDSLLVFTTGGWRTVLPEGTLPNPPRTLDCAFPPEAPESVYLLPRGGADSIPVGAPMRVFRRHTYHLARNGEEPWLARTGPGGTELLVGPLHRDGLRFRVVDSTGEPTGDTRAVTGVEVTLILPLTPVPGGPLATADTLTLVLQGRNR